VIFYRDSSRSAGCCSVPELSEHALDKSGRLLYFDGRRLAAFFQRREYLFDFAVNRESASARFREDQLSIDDDVELTGFAGGDFRLLAEGGI
jgi:hypothetical protein